MINEFKRFNSGTKTCKLKQNILCIILIKLQTHRLQQNFFLSLAEATIKTEAGKLPRNTSYNFDLQNRYVIKKHSVGIELRIKMLTIL